jgi:hypothetical protein
MPHDGPSLRAEIHSLAALVHAQQQPRDGRAVDFVRTVVDAAEARDA